MSGPNSVTTGYHNSLYLPTQSSNKWKGDTNSPADAVAPNHSAKFLEFGKLKRNPRTSGFLAARKRKGEDEQNIKQKHLARGNSAASSSYEPSYHHSTAASSTDTRHTKTRSEENPNNWESRAETSIRTESQKYVQQRDAAGQKPTPFFGDPEFNLTDNDKGKP